LQGFENYGHKLFTDNYYTSPNLAYELLRKGFYMTGICRNNRKGLPRNIKDDLKNLTGVKYFVKNGLSLTLYEDKKNIILVSNCYTNKIENSKPIVVNKYNLKLICTINKQIHMFLIGKAKNGGSEYFLSF
jgi:hypothetical protein